MAGNTKKVETTKLLHLAVSNKIVQQNMKLTICSRNLINASYILSPNEYTLFNFIIFMRKKNVLTYNTTLLKQYDLATSRMIELHGLVKVHYSTSRDIARKSFIGLIEKGYLIRLQDNKFMINPTVVIPEERSGVLIQKNYLEIVNNSTDLENDLIKYCKTLSGI